MEHQTMQVQPVHAVMRRTSQVFVGLAFLAATALGCTNGASSPRSTPEPTPTPTRIPIPPLLMQNFMGICVANEGSTTYCSCVMADMQAKYTLEEFARIMSRALLALADGDTPKEIAASRAACQGK